MVTRQGMGKGRGKGFKNIIGRDPKVHSDSAKGRKQPQGINPALFGLSKELKNKQSYEVRRNRNAVLLQDLRNNLISKRWRENENQDMKIVLNVTDFELSKFDGYKDLKERGEFGKRVFNRIDDIRDNDEFQKLVGEAKKYKFSDFRFPTNKKKSRSRLVG